MKYLPRFAQLFSRVAPAVAAFAALVIAAGCMDIQRSIVLSKDMTGKATVKVVIDTEAFVQPMLDMTRMAQGQTGPASPEEVAMMKSMVQGQVASKAEVFDVKAIVAGLPPGVALSESSQKADGLKITGTFVFAFSDLTKLPSIVLSMADMGTGGEKNPIKPFEEFEFKDETGALLITTKVAAADPAASPTSTSTDMLADVRKALDENGLGAMSGSVLAAMKGMKVQTRIETPFTVVESNEARKDGTALIWESSLDAPDPAKQIASAIKARYKK